MSTEDSPRSLLTDQIKFPEGPRWHDGQLWFEDTVGEKLQRVDADGNITTVADVPGRASGLGFLPDGTPLVLSMFQKKLFRVEEQGLVEVADLSSHVEHTVNDMIVDSQGRAYIGNFGYDLFGGADPQPTHLLLVEPDGTVRRVAEGLIFPNGMAITPDNKTMYVAETWGHRITVFDIEPDGTLSGGRTHADLEGRHPDGICLDGDGGLWVASAMESEFIRIAPDGSIDPTAFTCPGRLATSCALGGEDGRTLYMLQAEATVEGIHRGESLGFVETVQVDVPRGNTIP
jgi:sugar lactone lactonase YvrE